MQSWSGRTRKEETLQETWTSPCTVFPEALNAKHDTGIRPPKKKRGISRAQSGPLQNRLKTNENILNMKSNLITAFKQSVSLQKKKMK